MDIETATLKNTLRLDSSSGDITNILIIDSDELVLDLLTNALSEKNYLIDTAISAEIAINKIADVRYNLILLEVNLPKMPGLELLKYCQQKCSNSAVIMMTSVPDLDEAVKMMKEGAFDYIQKPIEMARLNEKLHNVLQKRAAISVDPVLAPIMKNLPSEYNISKIISITDTSIILLVEKESKYYAMKVLKYEIMDEFTKKKIKRFFREAQVMRSISHPNIVKVYEYQFKDDQLPYILAEYISGSSLNNKIINKMTFDEKLIFIKKLTDAIWAIHKKGISHRDIKPSNIMVGSNGDPKLTDFGIAGIKDSSLTMTKEIMGSPKYMPPEAFISFRQTDSRSDIFALGLVAYEMLTGKSAFEGNNINQIIHAVSTQKPIRPSQLNDKIPSKLDDFLARALVKDPDSRYQNAASMAMDLDDIINNKEVERPKSFIASLFSKNENNAPTVWIK